MLEFLDKYLEPMGTNITIKFYIPLETAHSARAKWTIASPLKFLEPVNIRSTATRTLCELVIALIDSLKAGSLLESPIPILYPSLMFAKGVRGEKAIAPIVEF